MRPFHLFGKRFGLAFIHKMNHLPLMSSETFLRIFVAVIVVRMDTEPIQ